MVLNDIRHVKTIHELRNQKYELAMASERSVFSGFVQQAMIIYNEIMLNYSILSASVSQLCSSVVLKC